jgi:hypothetical protein
MARRGMQQSIEAVTDDIQHNHSFRARFVRRSDAPERPLVMGPPCQSGIK